MRRGCVAPSNTRRARGSCSSSSGEGCAERSGSAPGACILGRVMNVLVTGGAGYIGSHMVRALLRAGHKVVVVDNLLSGHRDTVPAEVPFVEADIRDRTRVADTLKTHGVGAIFHFAARIQVGES